MTVLLLLVPDCDLDLASLFVPDLELASRLEVSCMVPELWLWLGDRTQPAEDMQKSTFSLFSLLFRYIYKQIVICSNKLLFVQTNCNSFQEILNLFEQITICLNK